MLQINDFLPPQEGENYWTFWGRDHEGLPNDKMYVVFEYYCDTPHCDCRRVIAKILQMDRHNEPILQPLAIVEYDWSSDDGPQVPRLADQSPQTKIADHLLEVYKKFIDCDDYVERIKEHYLRVKEFIAQGRMPKYASITPAPRKNIAGRNDPCPCGSNRKYKKCCLGKL